MKECIIIGLKWISILGQAVAILMMLLSLFQDRRMSDSVMDVYSVFMVCSLGIAWYECWKMQKEK